MKKLIAVLSIVAVLLGVFAGCAPDSFGHETYTDVADYYKIFELTELREKIRLQELFPEDISDLDVQDFYSEWELGLAGSADYELYLSIQYSDEEFNAEIDRIKNLYHGCILYDTEHFRYPAYALVVGYMDTSVYALVDESNSLIHYVCIQLMNDERLDIPDDLMPIGYHDFGEVEGIEFHITEKNEF
ncbi:MAG: hypothetical protein IJ298_02475, partial [Ruminococcus sp.]|nr:hypothetical protein [Ruminococcus sp.]